MDFVAVTRIPFVAVAITVLRPLVLDAATQPEKHYREHWRVVGQFDVGGVAALYISPAKVAATSVSGSSISGAIAPHWTKQRVEVRG
jgi:hypothetical protein